MSNLRFDADYVLVDVDASPARKEAPHAKARRKTTNVIDLVSVLQKSVQDAQKKSRPKPKEHRKAA